MKWILERPPSKAFREELSWYWTGQTWTRDINRALRFDSAEAALGERERQRMPTFQACALQVEK